MGVAQQPQPQSQAAPQPPILANILIQKKEQKSLLLESVIDFASLVFHCVGIRTHASVGNFLANYIYTPSPWRGGRGVASGESSCQTKKAARLDSFS